MAGSYYFGTGTLSIGVSPTLTAIGTLQDVTINSSRDTIPLMGNYSGPVALALGPLKVTGTAKSGEFDSALLGFPISNDLMEAPSEYMTITWEVTPAGGGAAQTMTLNGVLISSWKLQAKSDGWTAVDIEFAASAAADGDLITIT